MSQRIPPSKPSCSLLHLKITLVSKDIMLSKEQVKKEMFDKISAWKQSGLTQQAFCNEHNIAYHVFHYYYRRFRIKENNESASFIKLRVGSDAVSALAHIELILPDGKRLLFHQGVSAEFLRSLIS